MKPNSAALEIDKVMAAEREEIASRRVLRAQTPPSSFDAAAWTEACGREELTAVAISGGGIRSATFGLGVLQGLMEKGLLQQADYLSTVSGGGYVGSWLQGLICRENGFEKLDPSRPPEPSASDPIAFLRKYSNYLAPRVGLSLDALTIPAIWLRNTALNQTIVVCALILLVVLTVWPGALLHTQAVEGNAGLAQSELALTLLATVLAAWTAGGNLRRIVEREFDRVKTGPAFAPGTASGMIGIWVILPLVAGAALLVFAVASPGSPIGPTPGLPVFAGLWLLHALLQWRGGFLECYSRRSRKSGLVLAGLHVFWMSLASAGMLWVLLLAINKLIAIWDPGTIQGSQMAMAWATPLYLIAAIIAVSLQIGLMGQDFPDSTREWLARAGAFLAGVSVLWAGVLTVAVFAPIWIAELWLAHKPTLTSGTAIWLMTTLGSVLAGKSAKTGKPEDAKSGPAIGLDLLARYGPFLAIGGFLIFVSFEAHALLYLPKWSPADGFVEAFAGSYWTRLQFSEEGTVIWSVVIALAAAAVTAVLSLRLNINEFSLHHFYKNRLVRCYLGASNTATRVPDSFTGFDASDDIPLYRLRHSEKPTAAPLPIVNATLNVTAGTELATQERKALSWVFTPLYSGFVPALSDADRAVTTETGTFVDSKVVLGGGVHLGTAMAISGAAVSPNMGYHSSPQTAFLLTLFNVRLGWWTGNPRDARTFRRPGPLFALQWLVRELLGMVDARSAYLSLSDGGHFENLGIYELVRRRCRYIIALDAEEDAKYEFQGLGSAVRKCRADFGIDIDIDTMPMRPKDGVSSAHCVTGRILYKDCAPGWILYLKSSLTSDEPADVQEYQREFPDFPQQSTLNQFFSESQFESYRRLGLHVARSALECVDTGLAMEESFKRLTTRWPARTGLS